MTIDLDDTLLQGTVFQAMARRLGGRPDAVVRRLDELFAQGLMGLEACFLAEYDLFYGRPIEHLETGLATAPWREGIEATVEALRAAGARVAVLTDQPSWVCRYVVRRFGFDDAICTQAALRDGHVGVVLQYNFEKLVGLRAYAGSARIPLAEVAHVGNGENDVPVFEAVGRAVAFNPTTDAVATAAQAAVRSNDLRAVVDPVLEARPG